MITQALLRCWCLTTVETNDGTKYQLMLCFAKKSLIHYLLMNKFSNFHPNLNQAKAHHSPCQKLKEEARVRFKTNEMLFHCLDRLKVYWVICYSIIKVGCATKKSAKSSWKTMLVSPWWCHSKKADFTFVFTTTSGQEGFPCWRTSSGVLKPHVSQHIFLT